MSRRPRTPGPRFVTERGIPVFLEPDPTLPLVDVEVVLRQGALTDPVGREGLTRLTARVLRRGPRGMRTEAFDEALDSLGAALGIAVSHEHLRITGTVIRRNLEPYLELVSRLISSPGLRKSDFARSKRETRAELLAVRDHDRLLAARAFRRLLFGSHPYGRPASGSLESVAAIGLDEVRAQHARLVRAPNLIVGVAGDVTEPELRPLLERALAAVPDGAQASPSSPGPRAKKGRRVVVVDKPQRTQTQLYVGALGARLGERDFHPLLVANTGFGGTFTSRLVKEIRSERGWSYGVGSRLGADRQREAWSVWSHPAAEQLLGCLELELELLERFVREGLGADEVERAKRYLIKSHAFDLETAARRLDPQLETALYGLPPRWHAEFVEHVGRVTPDRAASAVRRRLTSRDLAIAMVATVTDELLEGLRALSGVRSVDVIRVSDV